MKFIALAKGYFNDKLIEVGEKFDADEDFSGSWAVKAEEHEEKSVPDEEQLAEEAKEGLQGLKKPAKKKAKKKAKKVSKKAAKKE